MLDTVLFLETPERVQMPLRLAGFSCRSLAWLMDFALRMAIYLAVMIVSAIFLGKSSGAFHFLMLFLMEWLYPVLYEVLKQGQTPGKKFMGIKVIMEDGSPVDLMSSFIRNFLRVIDIYPFFYGIGLVSCLVDSKFRRLGDLAAKTIVIYRETDTKRHKTSMQQGQPLPLRVSVAERSALLSFHERQSELSHERCIELAEILEPLHAEKGEQAIQRVNAYVAYLSGGST